MRLILAFTLILIAIKPSQAGNEVSTSRLVYAYPLIFNYENMSKNEVFVTFHEPNLFDNPWNSISLKMTATIVWLIGLCGSCFIFTFVFYETQGYAASFRTVINQLVTWCYFYVSQNTCVLKSFLQRNVFRLLHSK